MSSVWLLQARLPLTHYLVLKGETLGVRAGLEVAVGLPSGGILTLLCTLCFIPAGRHAAPREAGGCTLVLTAGRPWTAGGVLWPSPTGADGTACLSMREFDVCESSLGMWFHAGARVLLWAQGSVCGSTHTSLSFPPSSRLLSLRICSKLAAFPSPKPN